MTVNEYGLHIKTIALKLKSYSIFIKDNLIMYYEDK